MSQKISVIIPTVQKTLEVLEQILELLSRDDCVEEIILINNKPDVPLHYSFSKLRIITPIENLYVNPSWNLGVKEAKCENFVLLNDDLLFGENFCGNIVNSDVFQDEKTGLIGMDPSMIKSFDSNVKFSSDKPEIKPFERYLGTGDWGISIFGKKSNWFEIPEDLKIIYGDNYILYKNKISGKINYSITNLPCRHMHSVSSASREFSRIIMGDISNSRKYFPEYIKRTNDVNENDKEKKLEEKKEITEPKNNDYKLEIKGAIVFITISKTKQTICMKYREGNEIYQKDKLFYTINNLIKNSQEKNELVNNIVQDILDIKVDSI